MSFELIKSETLMKGRAFSIRRDHLKTPDGRETKYDIIEHGGSVVIIPIDENGNVLLVRQYRHATGGDLLELPAGTLDDNEDPKVCAAREIREETGYDVVHLESLGLLYPTPGYSSEKIHVFYAEVDGEPGDKELDHDEFVRVVEMTPAEVEGGIHDGSILDGKTLAAWVRYQAKAEKAGRH